MMGGSRKNKNKKEVKRKRNYSAYQKQLIDIDFYVIGTSDY